MDPPTATSAAGTIHHPGTDMSSPWKPQSISFFELPTEVRFLIYSFLTAPDKELYEFMVVPPIKDPGSLKHDYLKEQLDGLKKLGRICQAIRHEVYNEFFHHTQIYLRHEPWENLDGAYYSDEYQQGLDVLIKNPILATHTKHVYWALMLDKDEEDIDNWKHRGIRLYDSEYEVRLTKKDVPWPWESYTFVMDMPNLTTLHIDVECYKDWRDLQQMQSRCMAALWEWPTMKKLTLRLRFKTAKGIVRKAFRSRWVKQGRPKERLTRNILNHLLTLPEVCFLLLTITVLAPYPPSTFTP
ncbi:hypothetical protein SMACR_01787 [Sordaria macrospora]|uniref:WGS project CABT00000000 data, contig 2.5 n=2 Tax=Sordaria macrospora TaxID=5147 RepID=F7VRV3_SORMK|nr:uncharacterized protein SMAC_01787 [Sordaria macrospora k-hell]KAA8636482.1 hypothetical protein SMACR_01787 [Sordaria macrospora]KAH7626321.1 hypothetical protein B0T09DRAFT_272151 [Sordaria sp. MPI-SDFR-AT-0083]CCC08239.1 unnamed protein product [Sordaria macrospora k-hell]